MMTGSRPTALCRNALLLAIGLLSTSSGAHAGAVSVAAQSNANGYFKYQFFRNGINFFSQTYHLTQAGGYYLRVTAEVPLGGNGCGYYACVVPQDNTFGPAKWTSSKCVAWWQDGYLAQNLGTLSFYAGSGLSASGSVPPSEEEASNGVGSDAKIQLAPALPNPSHGPVTLQFSLPQAMRASLEVYDASGRFTRRLLNGQFDAGVHIVEWDGRNEAGSRAPSGVYYYRLVAGTHQETKRLILF